ncbi:MAG: hypothetical protein LBH07_02890 [Treponema sp.]|nr:hypothetical protein [Treponema sp.]
MTEYIKRHMEDAFLRASAEYPALLLTGPREFNCTGWSIVTIYRSKE